MLPEGEDAGFELAQGPHGAGFGGSILFLTARDSVEDRIRGLKLGGGDYLIKPFSLKELLARARALLRRESPTVQRHLDRMQRVLEARRRTELDSRVRAALKVAQPYLNGQCVLNLVVTVASLSSAVG